MNTLFVPQVDEQMIRKRVKSFKQKSNDTPSDEAKMEDNKDPYLMDSEDDEDDDEINVNIIYFTFSNLSQRDHQRIKRETT